MYPKVHRTMGIPINRPRWLVLPHSMNKTNIGRTSSPPSLTPRNRGMARSRVNSGLDELCLESFDRGAVFCQIEFLFKFFGQVEAYEGRFVFHLGPH